MQEFSNLVDKLAVEYPDVFIKPMHDETAHLELSLRVGEKLLFVEYLIPEAGYAISFINSPGEGWFRGCDIFTTSFDETKAQVMQWLRDNL